MGLTQIGRDEVYDVVVIGSGVFGAWVAYECRLRGWSVLLIDSRGPANSLASSGGESRILRVGYGPQATYSRWALRSLGRWREFLEQARAPQLYLRTGVLWLGTQDDAYLAATVKSLGELDVRYELLNYANLRARYPQVHVEPGYMGVLESDSGTILARRAVDALVEFALGRGVKYLTRLVLPPHVSGRLDAICTGEGETIRGGAVYLCLWPLATGTVSGHRWEPYSTDSPRGVLLRLSSRRCELSTKCLPLLG